MFLILDSKIASTLGEVRVKEPLMNHKVALFLLLTASILISFLPVEAQQPKKVPRIGYLSTTDPAIESPRSEAIRRAAMWMSSH